MFYCYTDIILIQEKQVICQRSCLTSAYISLLFLNNRQQPAWDQFNQFFTPKDLNNREIIDGMLSSRSYFVD